MGQASSSPTAISGNYFTRMKSFRRKQRGFSASHRISYLSFRLFVTSLIPVLTDYPLAFAFMGDMLAGGFFLALGGFFAALAAVDTGNPYGPMGASRTRMVGFLAEPVFMIVFFTVSFVAQSTIPYIVQQKWVASPAAFFSPAHILLLIAFLMLILAEGGRIPVDNPTGHFELAMIDESKGLEYSGRGAALMKWGGQMKFLVLTCIFLNVLLAPWGLAHGQQLGTCAAGRAINSDQDIFLRHRSGDDRDRRSPSCGCSVSASFWARHSSFRWLRWSPASFPDRLHSKERKA